MDKVKKVDWKFFVLIVGIILNFIVSVKVMSNDLKHISSNISEMKVNQKRIIEKVERNSLMIERLDERTK